MSTEKAAPRASCGYQKWPLIHIIPRAFHLSASEGVRTDYEAKEPGIVMLMLHIVPIIVWL